MDVTQLLAVALAGGLGACVRYVAVEGWPRARRQTAPVSQTAQPPQTTQTTQSSAVAQTGHPTPPQLASASDGGGTGATWPSQPAGPTGLDGPAKAAATSEPAGAEPAAAGSSGTSRPATASPATAAAPAGTAGAEPAVAAEPAAAAGTSGPASPEPTSAAGTTNEAPRRLAPEWRLMIVNVVASLIAGFAAGVLPLPTVASIIVISGFCGGMSSWSSVMLDATNALGARKLGKAAIIAVVQMLWGVLAALIGVTVGQLVGGALPLAALGG